VTFVTNPFTLPFWLLVANRVGKFFLRIDEAGQSAALGREISSGHLESYSWFFQAAGATAVGFVLLAIIASAIGYLVSGWIWRVLVGRKLRAKQRRYMDREGELL